MPMTAHISRFPNMRAIRALFWMACLGSSGCFALHLGVLCLNAGTRQSYCAQRVGWLHHVLWRRFRNRVSLRAEGRPIIHGFDLCLILKPSCEQLTLSAAGWRAGITRISRPPRILSPATSATRWRRCMPLPATPTTWRTNRASRTGLEKLADVARQARGQLSGKIRSPGFPGVARQRGAIPPFAREL